jgi:hypothetical protein
VERNRSPGDEDSVVDLFQGPGGVEAWAIAAPTSALTVTRTCNPATPVMGRTCDLVSRCSDSGPEDLHLFVVGPIDQFVVGPIDQAVFVVDAAGPSSRTGHLWGFRPTYPGERVTLDLTDQARDPGDSAPTGASGRMVTGLSPRNVPIVADIYSAAMARLVWPTSRSAVR